MKMLKNSNLFAGKKKQLIQTIKSIIIPKEIFSNFPKMSKNLTFMPKTLKH